MSLIITLILAGIVGWVFADIAKQPPVPPPSDDIMSGAKMRNMLYKIHNVQVVLVLLVITMFILRLFKI